MLGAHRLLHNCSLPWLLARASYGPSTMLLLVLHCYYRCCGCQSTAGWRYTHPAAVALMRATTAPSPGAPPPGCCSCSCPAVPAGLRMMFASRSPPSFRAGAHNTGRARVQPWVGCSVADQSVMVEVWPKQPSMHVTYLLWDQMACWMSADLALAH